MLCVDCCLRCIVLLLTRVVRCTLFVMCGVRFCVLFMLPSVRCSPFGVRCPLCDVRCPVCVTHFFGFTVYCVLRCACFVVAYVLSWCVYCLPFLIHRFMPITCYSLFDVC